MKNHHLWGHSKYRAIHISVILFLVLDFSILISNFVISSEISQDAISINLSGRQRLLSQKMVKALLQIYVEHGNNTSASWQELAVAYQQFDETLEAFNSGRTVTGGDGQPVFLKAVDNTRAKHIVKQGINIWKPYREKLRPILTTKNTRVTIEKLQAAIAYASQHNLKLLDLMNRLTSELEQTTNRKAITLQIIQIGGMILVLLNFLVLFFYSFRKLKKTDAFLLQAHQKINALNQRIKAENIELAAEVEVTNRKLIQFLDAMPICVIVLDAGGKLFYSNQKIKHIFGNEVIPEATLEQLYSVYKIYKAGTHQRYPSENLPIMQALKGQSSTVDDVEIHQPDRVVSVEILGTPIFDNNNNVTYAITTWQDITARKQAETERERFTKELQSFNKAYERFVPREFLSLLNKQSVVDIQLGEQIEKEMTILFSDIRGFTSLSEKMTPQQNFDFINAYLSQMEPIIAQHHGFIDKYIGDAIMALFPISADDAVRGAIAMLKALRAYNALQKSPHSSRAIVGSKNEPIEIGIGLNTGPLMLGTVGGENRMDGTVISDAVNLASRVEGLTKIYHTPLLITEQCYLKLVDPLQYEIRVIDAVKVKGKSEVVTIYEIYDAQPNESIALKNQTRDDFELGFVLYHSEEVLDAKPLFEKVLQINKKDKAAQVYLQRCEHFFAKSLKFSHLQ
jgi:PAS domain S-box-containing protein